MKLAISNIAWTAERDEAVYALMQNYGYSGLEIAPTRLYSLQPYTHVEEAREWSKGLAMHYGFTIPSLQSIWYGRTERIFGSKEEREILKAYTRQAMAFAVAVSCKNLVFGCPRNRFRPAKSEATTAVAFFREMATSAIETGVVIGLEANPSIYNTNYINTTLEAIRLIEEVGSPGFRLNLDVGTMLYNRETVSILRGKVNYISHVHISEPQLLPVTERQIHQELALCLAEEGYSGFVSIEMAQQADLQSIEDALQTVRTVFC